MDPPKFTEPYGWTINCFDYRRAWYGAALHLWSGNRLLIYYRGHTLSLDFFGGMAKWTFAGFAATSLNFNPDDYRGGGTSKNHFYLFDLGLWKRCRCRQPLRNRSARTPGGDYVFFPRAIC